MKMHHGESAAKAPRILLVDDQELVRKAVRAVLIFRGIQVVEAEDGQDAVDKYTQAEEPYDLVILDVDMPRLTGPEALIKMRQHDPDVKAVMLSGGAQDGGEWESLEGVRWLYKPFQNEDLFAVIRETAGLTTASA